MKMINVYVYMCVCVQCMEKDLYLRKISFLFGYTSTFYNINIKGYKRHIKINTFLTVNYFGERLLLSKS